ncbi:MAG: ATP synthase F0 subunit B [Oscillospiraceae bacterium]|nr:ATP synthase F0 subunit B [Oscillospiraceae bacterium]
MSIPLNIDWQQILLHLFNFAILAGGLYLLLYRPVKQFMEQRQAYYQNIHQEAQQVKEQADQMKAEYQEKMSQVEKTIAQRQADAKQELEQLRSQQVADAKEEAEEILAKAQENAQREKTEMISKASKELVDIAVTAAEKIALGADGDPYEQFLTLAERRPSHDEQSQ